LSRAALSDTPLSGPELPVTDPGDDLPPAAPGPARAAAGSGAPREISRAVGIISAAVLLSRLLGFVRNALIAAHFGQNWITSAYLYAFTLPDTLWMLIAGGAFSAAFVPVVTEYFTHGDEEGAWKTYSIVTTFLFLCLSVLIPLGWIFARPIIQHFVAPGIPSRAFVPGFGWVQPLSMAVEMTRIVLPAQYCFFLGTLMMSMLQARKQFLIPALGPVTYNLGIILGGLTLSHRLGIAAFSWGALGGALVGNLLFQIWAVRGIGVRFRPSLELRFPGVTRAGRLVLPVIFGVSLPQAAQIVNGMFVARIGSAKSILEYTNQLMQLPLGIFGQAIGIAVLPTLSQQAAQKDHVAYRNTLNYGVRLALFLTVPASVLLIVLAYPLIEVVYHHGHFYSSKDTARAVPALAFYALGVGAWSAQAILARAFYARNDTWTPILAGTFVTFCVFVPLNFLLTPYFNVPHTPLLTRGPALATSVASTTNALLLLYFARRRFGGINGRRILFSLARVLAACVPMGAAARYSYQVLHHAGHGHLPAVIQLLGAGSLALAVYAGAALLLGCEEARELKRLVRRR
jgi:putative peptidoglycan lipid II flippase